MDNSSSDSWEEFEALGMPRHEDTDYDRGQTTTRPSPRSMANITSSREHERILNEMKFSGSSSYSRDGALKKSIMAIATGIKIMNSKNGEQSHLSPRSKETSKSPDVEMVVEDDENVKLDEEKNDEFEAVSNIRSRGWRIVKVRLSEIAAKAPKNGIDSTPITFRNIAQLVKAKEFRMMLKRRASFIENGRFQFEEAKQDLYARYKVDPHLVSKLANRSRENRNADSNGGDGGQSKTSDDKKK
ncbi:uncharacterized protein [Diadema antillarum]|uniref:uncharacterized protein n=1 Tax=Diadema antillarum TaxID=105358 RepID=UPI003A8BE54D